MLSEAAEAFLSCDAVRQNVDLLKVVRLSVAPRVSWGTS
jgi:hypothetical protein